MGQVKYDYSQLIEAICNNMQILISELDLDVNINRDNIVGKCPIHDSDNNHSLIIYKDTGKFRCFTHDCHLHFKDSILGFVRGVLSSRYCRWKQKGDPIYGWNDTLKYLTDLYEIENNIKVSNQSIERDQFVRSCAAGYNVERKSICSLQEYLNYYNSPPKYFLERGFSQQVLDKYYVRYCDRPNSKYFGRCLVPQLDDKNRNVIGISSRNSPNKEPKWSFNKGFPASTTLYAYSSAAEYIKRNRLAVIVESPGNVWKLNDAGIMNAVGIWGANGWNDYKRYLLDKLGVMRLVLALDNDDAGKQATVNIKENVRRLYNTVEISLPDEVNDIADMPVEQVKELFNAIK